MAWEVLGKEGWRSRGDRDAGDQISSEADGRREGRIGMVIFSEAVEIRVEIG
jgi:hypothetical protein